MHFKHPEILYFLFLLIIPILVHLFQLRRFKKQYFTNVRFLQQLSIQTRKSSKIKKWLLLATRLLLLASLIFAFAQPFFNDKKESQVNNDLYIILDNSFSMQAKGQNGELLKRAVEDLLSSAPANKKFSLLTNNATFWNTDIAAVRSELQNIKFSSEPFRADAALAKINARQSAANKDIVVITDGLGTTDTHLKTLNNQNAYFVIPKAEKQSNVSIDSAFISKSIDEFYEISIQVKTFGDVPSSLPIALYDNDKLVGKTQTKLEKATNFVKFTIPKSDFHGYAEIVDNSLDYDNRYFFSITKPELIQVMSIGSASRSAFLSKIYTSSEFKYSNSELQSLDYNALEQKDVVVINELDEIPQALQTTLKSFVQKGGNVIFIPSAEQSLANSNQFLANFGRLQLTSIQNIKKPITRIAFNHPLYAGVFEKKIDNFQYPTTAKSFGTNGASPIILAFEDQSIFLTTIRNSLSNVYVFTAPINKDLSNFQNSPLIVPTFYQMAQVASKSGVQSQQIGSSKSFIADVHISKDEIISIKNDVENFIPIQQVLNNRVKFTFNQMPLTAGNFSLYKKDENIGNISFNYARTESNLTSELPTLSNYIVKESVEAAFDTLHYDQADSNFWKLFLLLTLIFIITELLIQKFVK